MHVNPKKAKVLLKKANESAPASGSGSESEVRHFVQVVVSAERAECECGVRCIRRYPPNECFGRRSSLLRCDVLSLAGTRIGVSHSDACGVPSAFRVYPPNDCLVRRSIV
jgi:hypothetical protein